jgi:hypothetical protein
MIYNDINFGYEIDWGSGFDISYSFLTALFASIQSREQRCAIRNCSFREIKFSVWEEKNKATLIMNELRTAYGKTIYVPVFSEGIRSTDTGVTLINGVNYTVGVKSIAAFFNANNFGNDILVADIRGIIPAVRTTFSIISALSIYLYQITTSFSLAIENMIFYPLVPCYIDSIDIGAETDSHLQLELSFKEKQT